MLTRKSNQNELREKLVKYQKDKGVKWIFLADILEISKVTMSDFKNGRINLHDGTCNKLEEFLSGEGY